MRFDELGLKKELLVGINAQKYSEPTPIQKEAIPIILQGNDILAGAQTGTGKTAAFALPLLHLLSDQNCSKSCYPQALILTPTRELAAQVGQSVALYGQGMSLRSTVIFGGVGINPQKKILRQGVDIVIGTPGRLLDLANQRNLDLSHIKIAILDEADRMLDMGFIHDIRKIIRLLPKKRQTLFFSATYSKEIKTLSNTILSSPKYVEVARRNTTAETINQCIYHVPKSRKKELLAHLIKKGDWNQVLVFTKTKHGAKRLAYLLEKQGIKSTSIHGNKSQNARTRALAEFKDWKVRVLVATDIASRGLDIDQLPYVVNYELPYVAEDYIHRIGRTGRASCTGEAISLVSGEELKLLRSIEGLIKMKLSVNQCDGFSEVLTEPVKESSRSGQDKPVKKGSNYRRNHRRSHRRG